MFESITLKMTCLLLFFLIESKNLLDEMLLKSIGVDICN